MPPEQLHNRFAGGLLGLALGDALGAPHEGGPLERLVWRAIGRTRDGKRRWTDDTAMALDVAESLIERGMLDQDDLAARFARSHRWSRGYGPGTAKLLRRVRRGQDWRSLAATVFPGGSCGNGGAMRAPVVGLRYWNDAARLTAATRASAEITHAHPLGIEGAQIVAHATGAAIASGDAAHILDAARCQAVSPEFRRRFDIVDTWHRANADVPPREIARALGNGTLATQSCVTAVHLATRFLDLDFVDMIDFIARLRGDVDTIGAMAGAIWGAARGVDALPDAAIDDLEDVPRLRRVAARLFALAHAAD
jgi:ADP-ribosylglycohydrolase